MPRDCFLVLSPPGLSCPGFFQSSEGDAVINVKRRRLVPYQRGSTLSIRSLASRQILPRQSWIFFVIDNVFGLT